MRIYFLYDRKLLAKLSICAWKVINAFFKSAVSHGNAAPGASIAVQTYGDFLNFNPHLHAIVSDGCFLKNGNFSVAPKFMATDLSCAFSHSPIPIVDYWNLFFSNCVAESLVSYT